MDSSNELEIVIEPLEEIGSLNWFGGELLTKSVNSSGISVGGPHKIMFAPNAVNAQRSDLATLEWITSPTINIFLEFNISGFSNFGEKNFINV